jgi:hypothetical protein
MTRITGTLGEGQYTFMIISHSSHLRMRNVLDKICRENENTHFIFNNFFFRNRAAYEMTVKNPGEPDRPPMTVCRMTPILVQPTYITRTQYTKRCWCSAS